MIQSISAPWFGRIAYTGTCMSIWNSQHSLFEPDTEVVPPQSALSEQYIRNRYRAWLARMRA